MWWKRCCKNSTGHKRYLDLSYFKLSYNFGEHKDSKGQNYSISMNWMPKRQTPKNQCTARPQDMQLFYLDPNHFEICRFLQTFQHTQTIFAFQTDFVQIKPKTTYLKALLHFKCLTLVWSLGATLDLAFCASSFSLESKGVLKSESTIGYFTSHKKSTKNYFELLYPVNGNNKIFLILNTWIWQSKTQWAWLQNSILKKYWLFVTCQILQT